MVVLKPLEAAERDGDTILGVLLATGVNSDGRTMGLSMPNKQAQEALLRQVYGACGVTAEDVFYVEAHGTGTSVGDPIECEAIGRVLGAPRQDGSRCLIGSVKSNIGHLEPASGIAGLTKVLLSLRNGELPANLHYVTPNPRIDFDAWKLAVVDAATPLPVREKPLVFGINSFGFGGTNAHAVLQEYRRSEPAPHDEVDRRSMLLLSAQSEAALAETARVYAEWLLGVTDSSWLDICATAALCRSRHTHRLALAASTRFAAAEQLAAFADGTSARGPVVARARPEGTRVAFVYSGERPAMVGDGARTARCKCGVSRRNASGGCCVHGSGRLVADRRTAASRDGIQDGFDRSCSADAVRAAVGAHGGVAIGWNRAGCGVRAQRRRGCGGPCFRRAQS